MPCSYDDLDEADLIVLVGSNTAWCHPVIWQRIEAAREARGTKLVVIDPRRTETAERADLHLAIAPDSDVALFNGLLREMRDSWRLDGAFWPSMSMCRTGFWDRLESCDDAAKVCDISASRSREHFYDLFAAHPAHRHAVQPGREPVDQRHRQGQCDHQPPSRHGPHRQARRGAVQHHRPAQCDGRARGRRAGLDARLHIGLSATRSATGRSASGNRRRSAPAPA